MTDGCHAADGLAGVQSYERGIGTVDAATVRERRQFEQVRRWAPEMTSPARVCRRPRRPGNCRRALLHTERLRAEAAVARESGSSRIRPVIPRVPKGGSGLAHAGRICFRGKTLLAIPDAPRDVVSGRPQDYGGVLFQDPHPVAEADKVANAVAGCGSLPWRNCPGVPSFGLRGSLRPQSSYCRLDDPAPSAPRGARRRADALIGQDATLLQQVVCSQEAFN